MIRELYRTAFAGAGYEIQVVNDAPATYKILEQYRPDIIFVDIMLPGQSGMEILKELRTNPKHASQKVKIILLTNLAQENLAKEAAESNADGYIIKANTIPSDLIDIVKSYDNDKPAPPAAPR